MKTLILSFILVSLVSCRETTSDDEITKTQLRTQLKSLQDIKRGDLSGELASRSVEEKEKLAAQVLASLDEETLRKLTDLPRFKEMIEKRAEEDRIVVKEKLKDLENLEEGLSTDLGMGVTRDAGALRTRIGFPTRNPYLQYSVHSRKGVMSCDNLERTFPYWEEVLSLRKNPSLLLGMSTEAFEQSIKSCLLFYRLQASIERCHFPYKVDLEEICRI